MSEAIILCEGYDDRAFWAGWLERLGCPSPPDLNEVRDEHGELVKGGHFGYYAPAGRFIRLVPCKGYNNVLPAALRHIRDRAQEELSHLILCVDPDVQAEGEGVRTGLRTEDVFHRLAHEPTATRNADGDIEVDGGAVKVALVRWEVTSDSPQGVPPQQTLERLACSALIAAYPERGPAVAAWLDGRPDGPAAGPKEHAWSHMAGWYAEFGCARFYKNLWTDPKVACELETRLRTCGAWRIAETLAG